MSLTLILFPVHASEILFCKSPVSGKVSYTYNSKCPGYFSQITRNEFCETTDSSIDFDVQCKSHIVSSKSSNESICKLIVNLDGSINNTNQIAREEASSRDLSIKDCKILTGRLTKDEKDFIKNQAEIAQKKARIKQLKSDCEDIGFNDGTEAMGNCVLKLMELQGNNSPTIVTTTTSNSSQEIVDIEKQKLQAQREALKLQQDQLKAEQERVAQERRKAQKKAADQSIKQGLCLMNGGSYAECAP